MSETRTLTVTAEDIVQSRSGSANRCPFALAAMRLFGRHDGVSVVGSYPGVPANILVISDGNEEYWDIGEHGGTVIAAYDCGERMEPGQYVITRRDTT